MKIEVCKAGGFDTIDFGLYMNNPEDNIMLRNDYVYEAEKMRNFCDKLGVTVNQTHARNDFICLSKEEFKVQLVKIVNVSKILGADAIVVHADTYNEHNFDFNRMVDYIYDVYAPMVEEAKKQNIKIAMETLFEYAPYGARKRFSSYIEELDAIVSKFNDPAVGICWDFGHAKVSYEEKQFDYMKMVGSKIISTHVHDNVYEKDLHSMPFLGNTDWELGMKTLKEVGYNGDLTLELVYGCLPNELLYDYMSLCNKVGKYLINKFNQY